MKKGILLPANYNKNKPDTASLKLPKALLYLVKEKFTHRQEIQPRNMMEAQRKAYGAVLKICIRSLVTGSLLFTVGEFFLWSMLSMRSPILTL